MKFLQISITSFLLDPNILLSALLSYTLKPKFFPQCDKASFIPLQSNIQTFTAVKTSNLILQSLRFYTGNRRTKQAFPELYQLLISLRNRDSSVV
jgi:hypothetical protein